MAAVGCAARASAFVRTRTADGHHFLWWPERRVGHVIQSDCALRPGLDGGVPPPEAVAAGEDAATYLAKCQSAVEASFLAWQNAGGTDGGPGCTDLHLPLDGDVATREVGFDTTPGATNTNMVLFQPQLCDQVVPPSDPCWSDDSCDGLYACFSHGAEAVALTTTTYSSDDGTLVDADIEVNDAPPPGGFDFSAETATPLAGTSDVENTVTHEVGHFIGLDHNCGYAGAPPCTPALEAGVMFASATPGETTKRTLKADDVTAICHVYPKGTATQIVNLFDLAGDARTIEVTGGIGNCATGGGSPALLLLLATLRLRRRRRKS